MKIKTIRNWLGIYFLLFTSLLGGYILIFKESMLLPITEAAGIDSFEIIIPVLVGQLTIIFKWFGIDRKEENIRVDIPSWVVKGPPIIITILIIGAILSLVIGNLRDAKVGAISANTFKGIVTFCITILNATTLFIVGRFFKVQK
jgi:uncharacterized protein YacL